MTNDLLAYLPDYYDGVYEMEAIMHAHGGVLDEFDSKLIRTLLNQFVTKTDKQGIAVYEDQLGIKPEVGDDLLTRQNRVLMRLLPPRPITIRYLRELFRTLKLPVTISVDYGARKMDIKANRIDIDDKHISSIRYILNIYLPANMIYQIAVELPEVKLSTNLKIGVGFKTGVKTVLPLNSDYIAMLTHSNTDISSEIKLGVGQWFKVNLTIPAATMQFENKGE